MSNLVCVKLWPPGATTWEDACNMMGLTALHREQPSIIYQEKVWAFHRTELGRVVYLAVDRGVRSSAAIGVLLEWMVPVDDYSRAAIVEEYLAMGLNPDMSTWR